MKILEEKEKREQKNKKNKGRERIKEKYSENKVGKRKKK